jgi:hypothetical protein
VCSVFFWLFREGEILWLLSLEFSREKKIKFHFTCGAQEDGDEEIIEGNLLKFNAFVWIS